MRIAQEYKCDVNVRHLLLYKIPYGCVVSQGAHRGLEIIFEQPGPNKCLQLFNFQPLCFVRALVLQWPKLRVLNID